MTDTSPNLPLTTPHLILYVPATRNSFNFLNCTMISFTSKYLYILLPLCPTQFSLHISSGKFLLIHQASASMSLPAEAPSDPSLQYQIGVGFHLMCSHSILCFLSKALMLLCNSSRLQALQGQQPFLSWLTVRSLSISRICSTVTK